MPVLDTDAFSIIQRRNEPAYTRLATRLDELPAGTPVSVTIVSYEEQLRGWLAFVKRAHPKQLPEAYRRLGEVNQDFSLRPVLPFDDAAADQYVRLLRANTRIGAMDLRIAAIVLTRDEVLVTANIRDFRRVPGLRVEDWTKP